jgi:hypothetical protein
MQYATAAHLSRCCSGGQLPLKIERHREAAAVISLAVRSTPTPSPILPLLMDGTDVQHLSLPGIETYLVSSQAASIHRIDSRTGRELGLTAPGPSTAGRRTNHDFYSKTQRLMAVVHT